MPAIQSSVGIFVKRLPHLARRFFGIVAVRDGVGDFALPARYLSPDESALFLKMTDADRRHSLDLCAKFLGDGQTDGDLLRAALLHDVGKSAGRLPIAYRVAYSLAAHLWPALARRLADSPGPGWRQPFYVAARHAELGATLAERAGSSPRVVALIRGHEGPGEDELSQLLYDYDRSM